MKGTFTFLAAVLASAAVVLPASAGIYDYDDAAAGRFNDSGTWTPTGVPIAGNLVQVNQYTVGAQAAGEVPALTVDLSGTGVLDVGQGLAADVNGIVDPGATINVAAGGTLGVRRGAILPTLNLNGGRFLFSHYSGTFGSTSVASTVTVSAASTVEHVGSTGLPVFGRSQTVFSGSGQLIKTGSGAIDASGWSASSTWNGGWDIQAGKVRMGTASVKGSMHIAAGAQADHVGSYTYNSQFTGNGTIGIYASNTVTMGLGATMSPGDSVGHMAVVCTSGTSVNSPMLRFASGSTYVVQIQGTTDADYDYMTVTGKTTGQGKFDIQAAAVLDVTLWTPAAATNLDATILRAYTETGDPGLITATVPSGFDTILWHNDAGWDSLAVSNDGQFLHVTGHWVPEPATMAVLALGLAGLAARRRRSR